MGMGPLDAMNPSSWDDEFTKQGLFIDDVYQLRILDPVVADQTLNLKKECDHFLTTTLVSIIWSSPSKWRLPKWPAPSRMKSDAQSDIGLCSMPYARTNRKINND